MPVRPPRVYIQRFNTTQVRVEAPATNRLARDGEVFFDPATRSLRMGDGVTAGGNILATADGLQTNQLVNDEAALVLEADGDIVIQGTIRDESGVDLLAAANGAPALPTASSTVKGGIKVGANLSIDGDGVLNAEDGNYTLPTASSTVKGGVKLGEGFSLDVTDKVTTNKLYNSDLTQPSQHYRLTLGTTGTITLPDGSEILGATLKTIHGAETYAGITAGPDSGNSEESWVWVDASGATIATKYNTNNYQWKFDNDGKLTLPEGGNITSPDCNFSFNKDTGNFALPTLGTVISSEGLEVGNTGNSEVYMGSGFGEFRSIYNNNSGTESGLTYAGVEGFNYVQQGDVNFSGIVSQTPNIDSMYAVGLNESGQIAIGFTQDGQTQESTDWSVTVGTLNTDMTVNGLFANTTTTVIGSGLSSWQFGGDGNITLSGGALISTSGYNSDSLVANVFAKSDQYAGLDWKGTNTVYVGPSGIDVYTNSSGSAYEEGSENLWNFGAGGNLNLPNGNVIGGAEITPVEDNTTTITNYAYDATGTTVGLTSGDTVDFPNFSGSILVNSYNGGGVTQYLCGGGIGNATAVGSSKGADVGSMDANSGIGGYTFTANETGEHCFYVIRTRTGA